MFTNVAASYEISPHIVTINRHYQNFVVNLVMLLKIPAILYFMIVQGVTNVALCTRGEKKNYICHTSLCDTL